MAAERISGDFGSTLKAARERRGVSLRTIANTTKISVGALEALERNDISRLPGGIYGRAFVRSYALEVGLDPEKTIEQFIAEFPQTSVTVGHHAAEQQELEEEAHESNQQTATTFVRLIVVSVLIVGGLVYYGTRRSVERTPVSSTMPPDSGPGSVPPPVSTTAGAGTRAEPPAPLSPVAPGERVTVALVATAPCWVSAIVDDQRVVARQFQTGERMAFEAGRTVVLTAGDAAAISVTINGEEARRLGSPGQLVTVRVTPDNFKEYLATAP
jgi:cytoskeleton protein RodZ